MIAPPPQGGSRPGGAGGGGVAQATDAQGLELLGANVTAKNMLQVLLLSSCVFVRAFVCEFVRVCARERATTKSEGARARAHTHTRTTHTHTHIHTHTHTHTTDITAGGSECVNGIASGCSRVAAPQKPSQESCCHTSSPLPPRFVICVCLPQCVCRLYRVYLK